MNYIKLRNKKTGEIKEFDALGVFALSDDYPNHYLEDKTYNSLAELNKDWEDYVPQMPLIKDEKIRKAVRTWAEANRIDKCMCKDELQYVTFETKRGIFITFEYADPIPPTGYYTIIELCGEKE